MKKQIFNKIINNHGDIIHKWSESDFGMFVSTGLQVGSDLVLIRYADGTLGSHENQCFFRVKDEFIPELKTMFKDSFEHDSPSVEYSICNRLPKTGFIIPSPFGPSDHTPMRDIREKLSNLLWEKFN